MSIQRYAYNFFGPDAFVNLKDGTLSTNAIKFLLSMFNRTGGYTGIVPQVTDQSQLLVASGTTIDDALMLVTDWNWVGTAAAGSGVQILELKPGNDIEVYNGGLNALKIYPWASTVQIDALGAGNPYTLNPGLLRKFECWGMNQIFSK